MKRKGELEAVFVELIVPKKKNILVGCIYKHPNMKLSDFNDCYEHLLEKISLENKEVYLMGDFNADLLKCELHQDTNDLLELNLSHCQKPFIIRPTRITACSKTLIDNIYSNFLGENYISGNLICTISDHLPQFLLSNTFRVTSKKDKAKKIYVKDHLNFDKDQFICDFQEVDWCNLMQDKDVNMRLSTVITKTNSLIDKNTPLKLIKVFQSKKDPKQWISKGLLKSINTKNTRIS